MTESIMRPLCTEQTVGHSPPSSASHACRYSGLQDHKSYHRLIRRSIIL